MRKQAFLFIILPATLLMGLSYGLHLTNPGYATSRLVTALLATLVFLLASFAVGRIAVDCLKRRQSPASQKSFWEHFLYDTALGLPLTLSMSLGFFTNLPFGIMIGLYLGLALIGSCLAAIDLDKATDTTDPLI